MSNQLPFLKSLSVEGLLSFGERVDVSFGSLNLLVGPNGSGKSNLIDCLRVFRNCPLDIQDTFKDAGFEDWLFRGDRSGVPAVAELTVNLPGLRDAVRHRLDLGPPLRGAAALEEVIENELPFENHREPYFFFKSQRGRPVVIPASSGKKRGPRVLAEEEYHPFQSILSQLRDARQFPEITRLASIYGSIRIYSEWSFGRGSELREATPTERSDTYLSEKMDDLAMSLNGLQGSSAHDRIQSLLGELKESYRDYVTRIFFGRVGLELKEAPFDKPLPAKRLSDGTLRFLALAAILYHPEPPPVVCLEEPELGMHPDMIRLVGSMIADASKRTQLIVTTHSEHLLTSLQDQFDVLFAFDAGPSGSIVRPLTGKEYHEWRAEHDLGELWSSGELGGVRY